LLRALRAFAALPLQFATQMPPQSAPPLSGSQPSLGSSTQTRLFGHWRLPNPPQVIWTGSSHAPSEKTAWPAAFASQAFE
jgi:hypothetical protein